MKFGAFIGSIFGGIFTFFSTHFARKAAITLTITSVLLATTLSFYIAIKALVIGVASFIPDSTLLMYFYALWPNNAETCFSAIFAAEIGGFMFRYKMKIISTISQS